MRKMRIAVRVDASSQMGTGHLMRCLTLAEALSRKGALVRFISRDLPVHLQLMVRKKECELMVLKGGQTDPLPGKLHHSHWLGTTQDKDASETINALSGCIWDWLVVDHYAIDQHWETLVAPSVKRLMVIDDLADRLHRCDLLLDQNLVADLDTRYAGKIPAFCRLLLGPEYALLQRDYTEFLGDGAAFKESIRRILIFFGGADQHNLTGRSISAVLALGRPNIEVDVVLGTGSPHENAIRRQVQGHGNIHLHGNLPSLAPLMRRADLAIGAGGTTSWERLRMGLPALVVTLAENQRPIASELHRRQLIRWLGDQDDVDELDFLRALRELIAHGALQSKFSDGRQVVDGKGVDRVLGAMMVTSSLPMRIRKATVADEAMLLEWANDPATRVNAFSGLQITSQAHRQWFLDRLENITGCRFYVVETDEGKALGQVRFELSGAFWVVDYSLSPDFRGLGLGRRLLEVALLQLWSEEADAVVFGEVKTGNFPSRKVFESLGFSVLSDEPATVKYISQVKSF